MHLFEMKDIYKVFPLISHVGQHFFVYAQLPQEIFGYSEKHISVISITHIVFVLCSLELLVDLLHQKLAVDKLGFGPHPDLQNMCHN